MSRRYFASSPWLAEDMSTLEHIFTRDAALGVMPIRMDSTVRSDFRVVLQTTDPDAGGQERRIMMLLGGRDHQHDLAESVCRFIEETTRYLVFHGEVHYEVVRQKVTDGDQEATAPVLEPLPVGKVWGIGKSFYQVVPRGDRADVGAAWVRIPATKIWHLRLPRTLGTVRRHRRLLRALRRLAPASPDFVLDDLKEKRTTPGYTFEQYRRAVDIALARLAHRWGRAVFIRSERVTEYYQVVQMLRAARAQACLREHLFRELNILLRRLSPSGELRVDGLPTGQDVDRIIRRLDEGEIDFKVALEAVRVN